MSRDRPETESETAPVVSEPAAGIMSTQTDAELRQKLAAFGLRALRERAAEDGVGEDDIDDARDGDDPKERLIALIVAKSRVSTSTGEALMSFL